MATVNTFVATPAEVVHTNVPVAPGETKNLEAIHALALCSFPVPFVPVLSTTAVALAGIADMSTKA